MDIVSWEAATAVQDARGYWQIAPTGAAVSQPGELRLGGWLHTPANAVQGELTVVLGYDAQRHLVRAWLPVAAADDDRRRRAARAAALALSGTLGCPVRMIHIDGTAGRLNGGDGNTAIIAAIASAE